MAAGDRLGGLAANTAAAVVLMRALYDRVLVETVGVGQSETDISHIADTVVFCVQPASGDALQFMKAGIMEVPDVVAVTKADLGAPAARARTDVEGAISLVQDSSRQRTPVIAVSAQSGEGVDTLAAAIDRHLCAESDSPAVVETRRTQIIRWMRDQIQHRFGTEGLELVDIHAFTGETLTPFAELQIIARGLTARLRAGSTG